MALFGNLSVLMSQSPDLHLIKMGIDYLMTVNMDEIFAKVTPSNNVTIEIKGNELFAIFQTYDTKPLAMLNFEGHKKYIDIQYIHTGKEFIGVTNYIQITEKEPYNTEKDIFFTKVNQFSEWRLFAGDGAILFPDDLHAPCMAIDEPVRVQKVVVKVLKNE